MNIKTVELKKLYKQGSKHSNYQILSNRLSQIVGQDEIDVKTRYESERLKFILENIEIKGKTILDIGGNTGYFTFELIDSGAEKLYYFEGNRAHSEFVQHAADLLDVTNKIDVRNNYYKFEDEFENKKFDIILLLNVLHHIGDDYGDKELTINMAKQNILKQLNSLADKTSTLVFQLGFNWKGNRDLGLFEGGSKAELIDFIREGVKNYWSIETIGIAESENESIVYNNLNDNNIKRNDKLGEFLNRPMFVLKSLIIN